MSQWSTANLTANIVASFLVSPMLTPRQIADDFGVTSKDDRVSQQVYNILDALEAAGVIERCEEDVIDGRTKRKAYRVTDYGLAKKCQKMEAELKAARNQLGVANRRVIELVEQQKTWEQVKRLVETAQ